MCGSALLRQEFLGKWMKGLQIYSNLNKSMSILDRKKAIKLSADVALASTRKASPSSWSQALLADVHGTDGIFVERVLGHKLVDQKKASTGSIESSKKMLRRSHMSITGRGKARKRAVPQSVKASSIIIAKKLVEKRTRVLKRLVPGGEKMDDVSLIQEALDYIVSLRVQRDVMRRVAGAGQGFELFKKVHCNRFFS